MTVQLPLSRQPANLSVRQPGQGWGRSWGEANGAKVSIHLPICNEPPQLVRATLDALAALDCECFEVLVVDSNTEDPHLWEPVAEHCARLGPKFRFFTLGKYQGGKAGALNFALRETAPDAEIIGVIDSGHIVAPDWLGAMLPAFADPKMGFIQSPVDGRDAGFDARHGTMTLIAKQALRDVRGWAEWCLTADAELGLRLARAGYKPAFVQQSFGKSVLPDDFAAWRRQRSRRAYGAMQILRAHAGALFNPFSRELTLGRRGHFASAWLPSMGDALSLLFLAMALYWSVGLILDPARSEFPIALVTLPSIGLCAFKAAQLFTRPAGAVVAELALSHGVGKAVWRGLFANMPAMAEAPVLARGLASAREESGILLLCWGALLGVGIGHDWATPETRLWCAMLFIQSLPYLAAVGVAILSAMSSRRPKRAATIEHGEKFHRAGLGRAS